MLCIHRLFALVLVLPVALAGFGGEAFAVSKEEKISELAFSDQIDLRFDDELALFSLELELDQCVSVATGDSIKSRETPGIISIITGEEMSAMGARDLLDVLQRVPGFEFGTDVQGVLGLGVRGNWAHEGKALLLIDGHEINETIYSTLQFGHEFPVEQIDRIEIIRGPGSVMYGGYAGLAVINVVTNAGCFDCGHRVSVGYGRLTDTMSRQIVSGSFARALGNTRVGALASVGTGNRSEGLFTDFDGESYEMAGNSGLGSALFGLNVGHKGLDLRLMANHYRVTQRDGWGFVDEDSTNIRFNSLMGRATWRIPTPVAGLEFIPHLSYKRQLPWYAPEAPLDDFNWYDVVAQRAIGGLRAEWTLSPRTRVIAGLDATYDRADLAENAPEEWLFEDEQLSVSYWSASVFTQARLNLPVIGLLTAGGRYEHQNSYGDAFVPRLALTRVMGPFHLKLLASQSYRAPAISNIAYGDDVVPEETTIFEIEGGYLLTPNLYVGANVFDITIDGPILYYVDYETGYEAYRNEEGQGGTRGFELESRFYTAWARIRTSWAFYTADGKNSVEDFAVPTNSSALIGFPNHKVGAQASFYLDNEVQLSPSIVWKGTRYGQVAMDENEEPIIDALDSSLLIGASVFLPNIGDWGFDLSVGVHDLLNSKPKFLQPYNGLHAGLPGSGREIFVRLSWGASPQ